MLLCSKCIAHGYCARIVNFLVSDDELSNRFFVADVRKTTSRLNLSASEWMEFVHDIYRDYIGTIVDQSGREVFVDTTHFDFPHAREWFRDWVCTPPRSNNGVRLRREARERVRALATIVRASYPERAITWGLRPANDN